MYIVHCVHCDAVYSVRCVQCTLCNETVQCNNLLSVIMPADMGAKTF